MATTSPDDIWTPDAGDDYALTTDLAATADTIQDALNALRGERRPIFGRFSGIQVQSTGAGTVTSAGSMGALTGISVGTSVTTSASTRAKITLSFKYYGTGAGTGAVVSVSGSGATTIAPTVSSVGSVTATQQVANLESTYSSSWFVNLNSGTTTLSVVGQIIGAGGTRNISAICLLVEPVAE